MIDKVDSHTAAQAPAQARPDRPVAALSVPAYVLVTPARNEEGTIEATIKSVVAQSALPREWVVVSDGSVDRTDAIVKQYAAQYPFIRLLRLDDSAQRSFASVVWATEAGIKALQFRDFTFLGLLDADVRFESNYFQRLIDEFSADPRLGLAGGWVRDVINGQLQPASQDANEVAGATQFFRRECFESMGGLLAIPEGGWDAITCIQARVNGYRTRTFHNLIMEHLKPRNSAFGHPLNRSWQFGVRDYALASHPIFEMVKCASRVGEQPVLIGSIARLAGFFWSAITGHKQILPPDVRKRMRDHQMKKLFKTFGGKDS